MPKDKIYLAYGSNLNLPQMAQRCPTAERLGTAMLDGYGLEFRGQAGHAVATIDPGPSSVPALIWRIKPEDEKRLDVYEGWPRLYRKETVDVELDGKPMTAMVYIMNDGYDLGAPHPLYLSAIKDGYRSAGFDEAVLDAAVAVSISEHASIYTQLCERLNRNMKDYKAEWKRMSHDELISQAFDISVIQTIYEDLLASPYSDDKMAFLLRFENPLEVVWDQWVEREAGDILGDMDEILDSVIEHCADKQGYDLDPAYAAQAEPEPEMELE